MNVRVAVTGIGMLTPVGIGTENTWSALLSGISGVGAVTRFDAAGFPSRIAGELKHYDPFVFMSRKEAIRTDPFMQYALSASLMALQDAALPARSDLPFRTGVLIGSGRGGATTTEKNYAALLAKGPRAVSPFYTPMSLVNMASGYVAMKIGARGPCLDVSTACATGTHAIGEAVKMIQRGDADIMIAGGAEACITPLVLAGFCQAKALSTRNNAPGRASRPFDRDRDGFVLAEGAGILVLEELGRAERRHARIYAEAAGYGLSCDAYHFTLPDPGGDGPARAMTLALRDAGLVPEQIDYVNAHGTSTRQNDLVETLALKRTFGTHVGSLAVSSSKSMLGHMLGAAGAVEAGISVLAIRHGIVPPTINLDTPDPECDLDYVPKTARRQPVRAVLSNSLGFGGINAALVFTQYTGS